MASKCRNCGQNFDSNNQPVGVAINTTLCTNMHQGPFDILPSTGDFGDISSISRLSDASAKLASAGWERCVVINGDYIGTGFYCALDGTDTSQYILTANHVIHSSMINSEVNVMGLSLSNFPALVVFKDVELDMALLKSNWKHSSFNKFDEPVVGNMVFATGYPDCFSTCPGHVTSVTTVEYFNCQFSGNRGFSGGPVYTSEGSIIGMTLSSMPTILPNAVGSPGRVLDVHMDELRRVLARSCPTVRCIKGSVLYDFLLKFTRA